MPSSFSNIVLTLVVIHLGGNPRVIDIFAGLDAVAAGVGLDEFILAQAVVMVGVAVAEGLRLTAVFLEFRQADLAVAVAVVGFEAGRRGQGLPRNTRAEHAGKRQLQERSIKVFHVGLH